MIVIVIAILAAIIYVMMADNKREQFKDSLQSYDMPTWVEYCRSKNAVTREERSEAWESYNQLKETYAKNQM
jgi:hypothetical protein